MPAPSPRCPTLPEPPRLLPDEPETHPRPTPSRQSPHTSTFSKLWAWVLIVMVPATCLALATVSAWWIAPYLGLLAWVLFAPGRKGSREVSPSESAPHSQASTAETSTLPAPATAGEAAGDLSSTVKEGADATKARRGRGRSKVRAKLIPSSEPPSVSWIQVGPGKFVRVEGGSPPPESESESPPEDPEVEGPRDAASTPSNGPGADFPAVEIEAPGTQDVTAVGGGAAGTPEVAEGGWEEPSPSLPEAQAAPPASDGEQPALGWGEEGRIDRREPEPTAASEPEPPAQDEASADPWREATPPKAAETPPANGVAPVDEPSRAEAPEVEQAAVEDLEPHHDEHPEAAGAAVAEEPSSQEADLGVDPPEGDAATGGIGPEWDPVEDGQTPALPGFPRVFEYADVAAVAGTTDAPGDHPIPRVVRSTPRDSGWRTGRPFRAQAARSRRPRRPPGGPRSRSGRGAGRTHPAPRFFQPRAPPVAGLVGAIG